MNNQIILVGGFHEIIELAHENSVRVYGIIDSTSASEYKSIPIIGTDDSIKFKYEEFLKYPLIITPDNPAIRIKLFTLYSKLGFCFAKLVSKDAKLSESIEIGQGTIVQYGVKVSCETQIGQFVKLNYCCNITHNVSIGDFTTVAPNAVILGNARIGNNCYIGANATILPNVILGDNVTVGAGAVVTKSVKKNLTVKGIPAK